MSNKVFVIDSGSTDGTPDIARSYGAEVVHHDWEGYARQKNWGLENLPFESPWILIVDADEVITDDVRKNLVDIASRPVDDVPENGFYINRLTYFLNRPIRHCGYYPSWNLRFFKRGEGWYEDRAVHEHVIIDDPVGYIRAPMLHHDRRGLEHYLAKHNRYSTLEARTIYNEMSGESQPSQSANVTSDTRRRRWLKRHVMPHAPMPGLWRFLYMYILRLGILDGQAGLEFCKFISLYDSLVSMKLREIRRAADERHREQVDAEARPARAGDAVVSANGSPASTATAGRPVRGLAEAEGDDPVVPTELQGRDQRPGGEPPTQMQPEASPWTFREKVGRAIWMLVGKPIFRVSFHNWYGFRAWLLRMFGAKVGKGVAIRPSVNIEVPWMIEIDEDATVGDYAILYSLGPIRIGRRTIVSQYSHLCAGTHDYADHTFRLLRTPVVLGDDVWVGADAFIGPGVTIGDLSVVGARSSTYKDLPAGQVCVGNPAKPIKERVLR